jgi:prepilin peptidase CpaA
MRRQKLTPGEYLQTWQVRLTEYTSPLSLAETVILAVILLISVYTDIRSRKIYNWVTFPSMLVGLILNIWRHGAHGALFSLEGFGVAFISMILMAILQLLAIAPMRFADVKLLCAIGMITGPHFTLYALIFTAIMGGVLGLIFAARRGVLKDTVQNLKVSLQVAAAVQSADGLKDMVEASKAGYMPYAPAIACGVIAAWIAIRTGFVPYQF